MKQLEEAMAFANHWLETTILEYDDDDFEPTAQRVADLVLHAPHITALVLGTCIKTLATNG